MVDTYNNPGELESYIGQLVDDCESRLSEGQAFRDTALNYYRGIMTDVKSRKGFSSAVSADLRRSVKRIMPSIMRAFLTNSSMVEYLPVGAGDEESAQQATDYVNHVVVPESGAGRALENAIMDALLLKTGILKWQAVSSNEVKVFDYTGQTSQFAGAFVEMEGAEVIDFSEPDENGLHNFTVRMTEQNVNIRLEAVPRGSFLLHPATESIAESPMVGERQLMSRSDLISRGYNKEIVNSLNTADTDADDDRAWRSDFGSTDTPHHELTKSMEQLLIYELYVRIDLDDDGKAEIWKFVYCPDSSDDSGSHGTILEAVITNEAPYGRVVVENTPFMFEGRSLSDDAIPVQRIKTSLLRSALDNTYWQNNPLSFVNISAVEDPKSLYEQRFGKPILLKNNMAAQDAYSVVTRPFIAENSFKVMQFFDNELEQNTGATENSGGLSPEQLSGTSATAALMASEKGHHQVEMMIRVLSNGGIKDAFRGLLKLVIQHSDSEKKAKIKNEWKVFDPRVWNVDMDCVVNVGLGAGSRTQDSQMLNNILQMQQGLIEKFGLDNPFVKPTQLYHTMEKLIESAGFTSAAPYITPPDDGTAIQLAQQQQQAMSQGSGIEEAKIAIEREKAANKHTLDQQRFDSERDIEIMKIEGSKIKEAAQMGADLKTQQQQADIQANLTILKGQLDMMKHRERLTLEYIKAGKIPPVDLFEPAQPEGL